MDVESVREMQDLDPLIMDKAGEDLVEPSPLDSVGLSQDQLVQFKHDLKQIIESMNPGTSWFHRASIFWANLPLWLKVVAAIVLIVPPFVIGIVLHIASLIVISVAVFIFYSAFSFFFYNHKQSAESSNDQIEQEIYKLANGLDTVIFSLDVQSKKISDELDDFHVKNRKLEIKVNELSTHRLKLEQTSILYSELVGDLQVNNNDLDSTLDSLSHSKLKHLENLQIYQNMIVQFKKDQELNQHELSEKISELNRVKNELSEALQIPNSLLPALKESVEQLMLKAFKRKEDQVRFQENLDLFLSKKEGSADVLIQRLNDTQHKISVIKEALNVNHRRYEDLLNREDDVITRLEPGYSLSSKLSAQGFFSLDGKTGFSIGENASSVSLS